ncbi:MAG: DoxX family protein [Pseudomonadota bacterium]
MKKLGLGMTIFFAVFMLAASVAPKLLGSELAVQPLVQIGWSSDYVYLIGALELLFTILFLIPRTSLLGAIMMTGLLGGALASHLRADSPMFSYTLFSLYLGGFMWLALWLRDERIRKVFPFFHS